MVQYYNNPVMLGSFLSDIGSAFKKGVNAVVRKANPITAVQDAWSDVKKVGSDVYDAGKFAVNSTISIAKNPLSTSNYVSLFKQGTKMAFDQSADVLKDLKTDVMSTLPYDPVLNKVMPNESAAVMNVAEARGAGAAASKAASAAGARMAQQIAEGKRKEREAAQASAAAAAKAASRASAKKSADVNLMKAKQLADQQKDIPQDKVEEKAQDIMVTDPTGVNQIIDAANAAQNDARAQEVYYVMPNTDVKSDYTKWLVIGGIGLAALYLLRGNK